MLNLSQQLKLFLSGAFALAFLTASFAFIPASQDPGLQATVFSGATITTTARSTVVACTQGSGAIGRKTLVVWNGGPVVGNGGTVTVTAELRDDLTTPNFTSGYLAANGVATNTATSDTSLPTEAGGRYCQVTAVAATTTTITVTLRRE